MKVKQNANRSGLIPTVSLKQIKNVRKKAVIFLETIEPPGEGPCASGCRAAEVQETVSAEGL